MIRIRKIDPHNIIGQFKALPKRLDSVKFALGSMIAQEIKNDVVRRIPTGGGWLNLYRNSIDFFFDGKEWVVGGETDGGNIKNYNTDVTLLAFSATDEASAVLANYNDWPIDMVPAINKPYSGRVTVKSANKTQVDLRRKVLIRQMPKIRLLLRNAGFTVNNLGVPTINGRLTADLRAFSRQLEEGRGMFPFPSVPHWRPAVASIDSTLKDMTAAAKSKFKGILAGYLPARPNPMSSQMKSTISKFVRHEIG